MVKSISPLRFGKLPPKVDYRTLNFGSYLRDSIPEPPSEVDHANRVRTNLDQRSIEDLFPMYSNDEIGDCTVAGAAHGMTLHHGMIDELHIPEERNVIRIYYTLTGGSDTGLYLIDVVKYWRSIGIEDSKIYAYASINRHNRVHIKQAIQLFGGILVGFQCQENVIEEFNAGIPWRPGKLVNAGHAIYVTGYDDLGLDILTWGTMHRGTWDWWNTCVDECYATLPPEAQDPDFTPGFDFERLKKDLQEVARII